jgi:hypothetical protein
MKKLLPLLLVTACAHQTEPVRRQADTVGVPLVWEELVHANENAFQPNAKVASENLSVTSDRLIALPPDLRRSPDLAQLALNRALEQPQAWEGGVAGLLGTAKVYVTTTNRIKDYEQLYVIMVRMLSQKYGCLMIEKQNYGDETTRVRCRDLRQVMMWKSTGPGWIQFHARQFDRDGYEIVVRKRRIVRVSDVKML